MKKKLLLLTVLVMTFVCLLAIVSSAEEINPDYNEQYVRAMTSTMTSVTLASGQEVPLYDEQGYTLCYYWEDLSKTNLKSVRTKDLTFGFNGKNLSRISLDGKELAGQAKLGLIVVVNLRGLKNSSGEEMTGFDGDNMFKEDSPLQYIFMPDSIVNLGGYVFGFRDGDASSLRGCFFSENSNLQTIGSYAFWQCKQLRGFYMPEGVKSIGEHVFQTCNNLFFVDDPNDPYTKPDIYYFPKKINTAIGEAFDNCWNLNNTLVFTADGIKMENNWCFEKVQNGSGGKPNVVFLGDVSSISVSAWAVNIYFANKNDIDKTTAGVSNSGPSMYFCHAQGNTTHLVEKNLGTKATCIANEFVETYCFCGNLVEKTEKQNTKTGIHIFVTNDCTVSVKCTDDEKCVEMSVPQEAHALVHTLVYSNGFDAKGLYNHHCTNDKCTMAGKEIIDETKDQIIVFKGYSVPEKANYKGINAGFEIDKTLLALYEKVNSDTVKFNLLMVNSETSEKQNISAILDGEELATGVKGINIKITSTNYCDIDVSVRGFDDSAETGNFYTLKLITALAVRTKDSVHYAQGALKNSPNTTIDVGGTAFNIVTANNVYNPVNS